MKLNSRLTIFILVIVFLIFSQTTTVFARSSYDDKVIFGGNYTLAEGETLTGSLVIFGGQAIIEHESKITGDIFLAGGTITIDGTVMGEIIAMGGTVTLGDTAEVYGDVATIGATLHQSDKAKIRGNLTLDIPSEIDIPKSLPLTLRGILSSPRTIMPSLAHSFEPIGRFFGSIFQALALAALAILFSLFLEKPTGKVVKSLIAQPIVAGSLGLLSILIIPAILIVMAITIILIPFSILGFIVFLIAILFGWIAIGLEVGNRMAGMFKTEWSVPLAAGIGTLILTLVVNWLGWIPCIGWLIPAFVAMLGLGAVIISQFGTRVYAPLKQNNDSYPEPADILAITDDESNIKENLPKQK